MLPLKSLMKIWTRSLTSNMFFQSHKGAFEPPFFSSAIKCNLVIFKADGTHLRKFIEFILVSWRLCGREKKFVGESTNAAIQCLRNGG